MTFYILIYFLVLLMFVFFFLLNIKSSQNIWSQRYLSIAIFSYILWNSVYLLSFTSTVDPNILVFLSRFLYSSAIVGEYTMLLFFLFYGVKAVQTKSFQRTKFTIFLISSCTVLLIGTLSGFIIKEMTYDIGLGFFSETYGYGISIYYMSQFLFYICLILIFLYKRKKLFGLKYERFKFLYIGYISHIIGSVFTLVLLPAFGIFILQKEQILFFIPFIFSLWYVSHRYNFFSIPSYIGRILIFLSSICIAFGVIKILDFYFLNTPNLVSGFWGIGSGDIDSNIFFGIILFASIYKFLGWYIIPSQKLVRFEEKCRTAQNKIPFFTNIDSLNSFLIKYFSNELKIKYFQVEFLKAEEKRKTELSMFFNKDVSRDIFINDVVFIEENKYKYNVDIIHTELSENTGIILPLRNLENQTFGFVSIGPKSFGDFYSYEEIEILKGLALFLQGHAKYIHMYSNIQDLNKNLDRKVDEKTLEYNNLLNRQKEFISYVSHEIRNSVTNTLFLGSTAYEGLKEMGDISGKKQVQEDVKILNKELYKVTELVKNMFSIEKFDLSKVKLYLEKVNLANFVGEEVHAFQSKHPYISFINDICDVGEIEIDQVQFRQVLHNLIGNAVKFVGEENAKISIHLTHHEDGRILLDIDDNGDGFSDMNIDHFFEKYRTGDDESIGLGLGLYLCKKIVDLHGGKIIATKSLSLGGARFSIFL